jgi:hypothetical protein
VSKTVRPWKDDVACRARVKCRRSPSKWGSPVAMSMGVDSSLSAWYQRSTRTVCGEAGDPPAENTTYSIGRSVLEVPSRLLPPPKVLVVALIVQVEERSCDGRWSTFFRYQKAP